MSRQRIFQNLKASTANKFVLMLQQLALVPAFLYFWGAETYGAWLVLVAVPSFLSIAKFGIGRTTGTQITIEIGQGRTEHAYKLLLSGLTILSFIFLFILGIVFFVPWEALNLEIGSTIQNTELIIYTLVITSFLHMFTNAFEGFYVSNRKAALGIWIETISNGVVALATVVFLFLEFTPLYLALATSALMVAGRVIYVCNSGCVLIHVFDARVDRLTLFFLLKKGTGFQLGVVWQALYFQGSLWLAAAFFGPIGAATWGTLRTLSRSGNQLLTLLNQSVLPEFRIALAEDDISKSRILHNYALCGTILLSLVSALGLIVAGPWVYNLWTAGELGVPYAVWPLLGLSIFINSLWSTSSMVPLGLNEPWALNIPALWSSVASLLLTAALFSIYDGIIIFPAGTILFELMMTYSILTFSFRRLVLKPSDIFRDFLGLLREFGRYLILMKKSRQV